MLRRKTLLSRTLCLGLCLTGLLLGACSTDGIDPFTPNGGGEMPNGNGGNGGGGMSGNGQVGNDITLAGLTDFDIAFNYNTLSESETIPSDDEDYYENAVAADDFKGTVTIAYNGTQDATVTGASDDCSASVSGGDVVVTATKAYRYVLSGNSSNGRFKIYSEKKFAVVLNGVDLTNPTGAVLNLQSKKRAFLVVNDGTENTLTDGSEYTTEYDPSDATSAEKQKGTIYTKGQLILSGKGLLSIYANYKHGIDTKDYLRIRPNTRLYVKATAGNCIKCENSEEGQGLIVEGGVLNLENSATAGKGLSSDGECTINGGRITAICSGTGEWDGDDAEVLDVSGSAGIKSDSYLTINGGDLYMKSTGNGGKGLNSDAAITINGGTVHVITTGSTFSYTYNSKTYETSPKGIKTDTDINVNGGEVYVRATGTTDGSEGIEAKQVYTQTGGKVYVLAADDALNTGYSSDSLKDKQALGYDISGLTANAGKVVVSDGTLIVISSGNDALDSNGTISISGGTICAYGSGAPETGFDCDQNNFSVTGGTMLGLGGASPSTPTDCSQPVVISSASVSAGTTYALTDSSNNTLASFVVPRSYSGATLFISSPKMQKGGSYSFAGTTLTCSSSSWVTGSSSNGMGGGMGFGGR